MASNPQIILIDGPAGAGKTTLSFTLQKEFDCEVIHLDDIYNGWDDALGTSLTNTLLALVNSFKNGIEHQLPIFNWQTMQFDSSRVIAPAETLIIEGVGAGQSAIRKFAKRLYWLDVEAEIGYQRVIARDGEAIAEQMKIWKIREAKHFEAERTREFADFIISTS